MWLLNVNTLTLEHFQDDRRVKGEYAILSHTWGDEEVCFDTIHLASAKTKRGYQKILYACRQAAVHGLKYAWVDTCCIDKRSSSELSEAINSMYRWYYNARVCYAFLSDITLVDDAPTKERLQNSRWFTRGWTLQELIAPPLLHLYDSEWKFIASRIEIAEVLSAITHIDENVLEDREQLWKTSVAKRMSWASMRATTREEDLAYSLLGIFKINMPLLYGEGPKAFIRLQEEIIRTWNRVDHSILAWDGQSDGLLATSTSQFPVHFPRGAGRYGLHNRRPKRDIISWSSWQNGTFELSNSGLRITLYARAVGLTLADEIEQTGPEQDRLQDLDLGAEQNERLLVALNCTYSTARNQLFAMYLRERPWVCYRPHRPTSTNSHDYAMYDFEPHYTTVDISDLSNFTMVTLTIAREKFDSPQVSTIRVDWRSAGYDIKAKLPCEVWSEEEGQLVLNDVHSLICHESPARLLVTSVNSGGSFT
jgi:hypothetical protein